MENKEKNFVSAVIYVHNAENRIQKFLKPVIETMEENFEHSEIILVNDYSGDGSVERIRELSSKVSSVSISVLNMSFYHGIELAMNAGVDLAIGDFVFEFDSTVPDFNKSDIIKVYKRALEGYDIVSASPDTKQKISSKVFYYVFDRFTDLPYKMCTESFRILSRRVINRISSMNKSVPYRKAVYANCGLKMDNIVYETSGDTESPDKTCTVEKRYRKRLAIDSLLLFTELGYRFSFIMTTLMIITTVVVAVYSLVTYLVSTPIEGWTTTILFLSFVFFGLFGILTVIIKYLQIIVNLVFKRKSYSFEGIEKLTK